jgi:hypothetical protein
VAQDASACAQSVGVGNGKRQTIFTALSRKSYWHLSKTLARLGIVYRAIETHLVNKAELTHVNARTGAVTVIQRFGSETCQHRGPGGHRPYPRAPGAPGWTTAIP